MNFTLESLALATGIIRSTQQVWIALAVTVAFAALARSIRGVTSSGALAGAVICFLLYAGAGPGGVAALLAVFALAWLSTRWGYRRKQELGTAERSDGRRASQVLANLGLAAICAILHATSGQAIYLLGMAAALSEAAADTVSSELGQATSSRARLITTWEWVPAGTDGGITALGTLCGVVAATIVTAVCVATGLISARWMGASITAAVAGMVADSYMGAWLERRRVLNNDAVNFLSTVVAVVLAFVFVL